MKNGRLYLIHPNPRGWNRAPERRSVCWLCLGAVLFGFAVWLVGFVTVVHWLFA